MARVRTLLALLGAAALALLARLLWLLRAIRARRRRIVARAGAPRAELRVLAPHAAGAYAVLAVLGSGGHTSEMLSLLSELLPLHPRARVVFVLGATDRHSLQKAVHVHRQFHRHRHAGGAGASFRVIPRAREVGEGVRSSALNSGRALAAALRVVWTERPKLVLCNGPANGAVVALAAFLLRVVGVLNCRVVYVESFARVRSLSLSGRVLLPFVDRFIVQWPQLGRKYALAEYYGRLC